MKSKKEFRNEKTHRIISQNKEGLEILAKEKPAREEREHPIRAKIKRVYRKYIKRPKAQPMVI